MNIPAIQWCSLSTDLIERNHALCARIREFEALPNSAGAGAQDWLHRRLVERDVPYETQLALDPGTDDVMGFYALKALEMNLSKDDSVKVRLRRLWDRNSEARRQPGLEICWIARSSNTMRRFGRNLFEHAVINAQQQNKVALVVTPHDAATEALWLREYHFMPFKNARPKPDEGPARLWYPVDELVAGSWPS